MTRPSAATDRGPRVDVASVVNVVENVLGDLSGEGIERLSASELERLAEAVNAFYDGWEPPPLQADEFRLYAGGWIAGNFEPPAREHLYTSLLYAPSVVMHDPIAEWFEPHRDRLVSPPPIRGRNGMQLQGAEPQLLRGDGYLAFRDDPDRTRQMLRMAIPMLGELAPLVRRGIVVPTPHWRLVRQRQEGVLSAVRHDSRDRELAALITNADSPPPRADRIRGLDVTPPGGVIPADELRAVVQGPSYFLNKTLAIADATASRYVPPAAIDAGLLEHRLRKLGTELRRKDIDLQVVAGLGATDLPFLGSLDPKTLVAIREDEPAFADWRAELRTIARSIEQTPSEGETFTREAAEAISDALGPRARAIERATSRSGVMKAAAKDQVITLGLGTASMTGAAAIAGGPIASAALVGLGISTIGRWAYSSLFGASPGQHGVLATLSKRP